MSGMRKGSGNTGGKPVFCVNTGFPGICERVRLRSSGCSGRAFEQES